MELSWSVLAVGVALVLVIEGVLYTLFPDGMRKMMVLALAQPVGSLRVAGISVAFVGVLIIWLVR